MSQNHLTLKDVPTEERPRERMLAYGPGSLSNAELLAILIRSGTVNESALVLAQKILRKSNGLRQLIHLSVEQLLEIKGIGTAKAVQIMAGVELGKRIGQSKLDHTITVRSPADVAEYLMEDLRYLKKEHFVCLFLNTKNQIIGKETLSVGSLNSSIVHPREVFQAAIQRNAASIICAHNHPSGDPTPSPEDIEVTERLVQAGDIVGIDMLDHLIIGDAHFVSLKQQGLM